jgi:formylglycine-generating enzyme required for sulfatase activity
MVALRDRVPLVLPDRCVAVGGETELDREGRRFYQRIRRPLPDTDVAIEFVLIPRKKSDDPPTFYIMVDKVSVGLFRRFAERHNLQEWKDPKGDDYPAFHMTVAEAEQFAKWLGGQLPTKDQWDKAAGLSDPGDREGPYLGRWDQQPRPNLALNRDGPMKVGEAIDAVSPFGCRDMVGNGVEWTRPPKGGRENAKEYVPLRGQRYDTPPEEKPRQYRDWHRPWGIAEPDDRGSKSELPIGFRVVLEP